jgi:hypothetical protein
LSRSTLEAYGSGSQESALSRFCLDALALLDSSLPEDIGRVSAKIGVHSGPVTAGIIGRSRRYYRLFGDTVNTSSRALLCCDACGVHILELPPFRPAPILAGMMSTGQAGHVHASEPFVRGLLGLSATAIVSVDAALPTVTACGFAVRYRGMTGVKGKGRLPTYLIRVAEANAVTSHGSTGRSSASAEYTPAPRVRQGGWLAGLAGSSTGGSLRRITSALERITDLATPTPTPRISDLGKAGGTRSLSPVAEEAPANVKPAFLAPLPLVGLASTGSPAASHVSPSRASQASNSSATSAVIDSAAAVGIGVVERVNMRAATLSATHKLVPPSVIAPQEGSRYSPHSHCDAATPGAHSSASRKSSPRSHRFSSRQRTGSNEGLPSAQGGVSVDSSLQQPPAPPPSIPPDSIEPPQSCSDQSRRRGSVTRISPTRRSTDGDASVAAPSSSVSGAGMTAAALGAVPPPYHTDIAITVSDPSLRLTVHADTEKAFPSFAPASEGFTAAGPSSSNTAPLPPTGGQRRRIGLCSLVASSFRRLDMSSYGDPETELEAQRLLIRHKLTAAAQTYPLWAFCWVLVIVAHVVLGQEPGSAPTDAIRNVELILLPLCVCCLLAFVNHMLRLAPAVFWNLTSIRFVLWSLSCVHLGIIVALLCAVSATTLVELHLAPAASAAVASRATNVATAGPFEGDLLVSVVVVGYLQHLAHARLPFLHTFCVAAAVSAVALFVVAPGIQRLGDERGLPSAVTGSCAFAIVSGFMANALTAVIAAFAWEGRCRTHLNSAIVTNAATAAATRLLNNLMPPSIVADIVAGREPQPVLAHDVVILVCRTAILYNACMHTCPFALSSRSTF